MNDRKGKLPTPRVEVIRRPASQVPVAPAPLSSTASTPAVEPASAPAAVPPVTRTATPVAAPVAPVPVARPLVPIATPLVPIATAAAPIPTPRPSPVPADGAASSAPLPLRTAVVVGSVKLPASRPLTPSRTFTPGGLPGAGGPRPGGATGRPAFPRSSGPRTPPTPEQIQALAKKQKVPARIAKGDLDGKMKCRIWRKLHAEEAKRFDQAYELMEKNPGLSLPDAFGTVQSGMTVPDFLAKRARALKKTNIKEARKSLGGEPVKDFFQTLIEEKVECSVVLGERTLLDVLVKEEATALSFERAGRIEKLQLVILARRAYWEKRIATVERDVKLSQKPQAVAREPERRPFSDPRPFGEATEKQLKVSLRNGIQFSAELQAVGPYDLLLASEDDEVVLVPLHALLQWSVVT